MRRGLVEQQEMYLRVGEAIRRAREAECVTQRELAERAGCSETHMNKVESAESQCSLHLLVRIADELDLSLDELVPVAIDEKELSA